MAQNSTQRYIGAPNGVVVCVDARDLGQLRGTLWHGYSSEGIPFENNEQMLFYMERFYDWLRFPFPGYRERTFTPEESKIIPTQERKRIMSDESLLSKHGDIGSFIVRVQHRQNSSWQGRVTWIEEDKTVGFRSVWELVKLMESAVDTVSKPEDGEDEASWFAPSERE